MRFWWSDLESTEVLRKEEILRYSSLLSTFECCPSTIKRNLLAITFCCVIGVTGLSAQYLNVTEGPAIRYNDTGYPFLSGSYTGRWDNGDTHASAWMDDGFELITYNDGTMPIPVTITGIAPVAPFYSNIGLTSMFQGGAYFSLSGVNRMADYGVSSQTNFPSSWTDDRTWKTSGIAPYSGCVYLTVQRQEDYDTLPGGGVTYSVNNGFRNGSSSIVKSCDHGATWANFWNNSPSPDGNAPPGNHQMWRVGVRWYANTSHSAGDYVLDTHGHNQVANNTGVTGPSTPSWNAAPAGLTSDGSITWTDAGPAIAGFVPVTYCQDNSRSCPPGADNFADGPYLYLTAIGAGDTGYGSYTNYYLARVSKSDFPSLDVSKYQYWIGSPGADIFASGNWGNSMVGAQPILNVTGMRSQVYYLPGVNQYVLINDTAHGTFEFWIASTLTGPWVKTGYTVTSQDFAEFPSILMSTVYVPLASPPQVTFMIEYTGCAASDGGEQDYPLDHRYSSTFKTITLSESPFSAVTAAAASFGDSVPKAGLVADLAFLPELGNTITDYSGAGHTATASYTGTPNAGSNYSTGGVWFNAYNPGNDSITGSYTVTVPAQVTGPFTLYVTYRKLQQPQNNECIVSGTQISICRNGTNHDDWLITVNGATTEWSDGSVYNGQYYNTGWDGSWNTFIINYTGVDVYTYNQYTLFAGPYPVVPLSGGLAGSNLVLGGNNFSGEIARFLLYSRSMDSLEMFSTIDSIRSDLANRNIYLSRPVRPGEAVLDSQGVPIGAWSVRKVLSNWNGPLMRVANLSSGASLDISADAYGNLDPLKISSFCGYLPNNCSPYLLYDQTGKGNTLAANFSFGHNPILTTCGSTGAFCIYDDGSGAFTTQPNFFFYGFTGGVSAVMAVDQANSTPNSTFISLIDGVADPSATPALLAAVQGDGSNGIISWQRGGQSPFGIGISNKTLFTVFSWFDSYREHFILDNGSPPDSTISSSPTQVRFQAYGFQVGSGRNLSTASAAAGYFSEVFLWDQSLSAGHVREIGRSESAYFGTP